MTIPKEMTFKESIATTVLVQDLKHLKHTQRLKLFLFKFNFQVNVSMYLLTVNGFVGEQEERFFGW